MSVPGTQKALLMGSKVVWYTARCYSTMRDEHYSARSPPHISCNLLRLIKYRLFTMLHVYSVTPSLGAGSVPSRYRGSRRNTVYTEYSVYCAQYWLLLRACASSLRLTVQWPSSPPSSIKASGHASEQASPSVSAETECMSKRTRTSVRKGSLAARRP